jgi:NAD(P)-dependent dehydrogenase (short-subunit alcohol dehydrogenase family)
MSGGARFLVTGAASGIGLAVARLALARGAKVALLDRDLDAARLAQASLGPRALAITCDVADPDSVTAAVSDAADGIGGLTAVVNAAGIDLQASLADTLDADWARVLAVNLTGPMLVCRAALPHLRRAGGGTIVNVSSAAGLAPLAQRSAYCATKAGVVMFGKALAMELAVDGIRVNAVCPGAVDTPLFRSSYENAADPEAELAKIRSRYAQQRIAQPEELAEAILFLSGPESSFVTGIALAVDGGRSYH